MESFRDTQLLKLSSIFRDASLAPAFYSNPKYCIGAFDHANGYIAYSDVMEYRFIIRVLSDARRESAFADEMTAVIKQYNSIEKIVDDGWILD